MVGINQTRRNKQMADTKCRFCGRKTNRNKMSVKQLYASKNQCKMEIFKINERISIQKAKEKTEQQKNNI